MLSIPLESFGLRSTWCKQFNRTHPHFLCATDQVELRLLRSPSTCVSVPFLACMLDLPLEGFGLRSTWCKQVKWTHPHFLCATDQVKLRLLCSPSTCVSVSFLACMLNIPLEGFGLKSTWCKQFKRTDPHFLSLLDYHPPYGGLFTLRGEGFLRVPVCATYGGPAGASEIPHPYGGCLYPP